MPIGFRISYNQGQFKRLSNKLSPAESKALVDQTTKAVADFLLPKIQEYPPVKHVTRKQAYGVTFFTDKQRRWFWAALRSGELELPYRRTGTLRQGWHIASTKSSTYTLTNATEYAGLVQERGQQSRMMRIIGWKTPSTFLQQYKSEIGRVGIANVRRWKDK
jgi:hypothetical protein